MSSQAISYSALIMRLLANARVSKGMEQAEVAESIGVTPSSYSRLESGLTALTVDNLFAVARVLKIDPVAILQQAQKVIDNADKDPDVTVEAITRKNTKGASESSNLGSFVTGAALGALIVGLLSKK